MTEQEQSSDIFDCKGRCIEEHDVLKIFHFTGRRGKKHYMYKWVTRDSQGRLRLFHLTSPEEPPPLLTVLKGREDNVEIVQSKNLMKLEAP